MKNMLQRVQQEKLECAHACFWHSRHNTRQKYTLIYKVLTGKTESSCPQPVPLGNLVGLKTTKECFQNWHHKHFLVKLEVEIYALWCKNEFRFLYKNIHSCSYIHSMYIQIPGWGLTWWLSVCTCVCVGGEFSTIGNLHLVPHDTETCRCPTIMSTLQHSHQSNSSP